MVNGIDILVLPFPARGLQQLLLSMTDYCGDDEPGHSSIDSETFSC